MGLIYNKASIGIINDKCLVLEPRDHLMIPFDEGNWNQIDLVIAAAIVDPINFNETGSNETIDSTINSNKYFFGLKNSSNLNLPRTSGSSFIGVSAPSSVTSRVQPEGSARQAITDTGAGLEYIYPGWSYDTDVNLGGIFSFTMYLGKGTDVNTNDDYCAVLGIRYTISNRGTATQQIDISVTNTGLETGAPTINNINSIMNSAAKSVASPQPPNFVDGSSVPYDIPDALYLRWPYYNNALRISSLGIFKRS